MKFRKPPRLATWILLTFGRHPDDDAILGDLHERYQTRQSSVWYWRETLIVLFNNFVRETWGHKLHSGIAIGIGWSTLGLIWLILEGLGAQTFAWNRHACTLFWCIAGTGSGTAVRLLTKHRKSAMIFLYAASVAVFLLVLHPHPRSHAIVYWIDAVALTLSVSLAAVPLAFAPRQPITPAREHI